MEPAPEQREVEGRAWWCLLVRGAPLANYGLVAHFPSCSPVVVVVAPVFEQRLTRLAYVLVSICLGRLELHEHVTDHLGDVLLKGAEGEAAQPADVSWAAMQRGFMEARDYSMLYLGVTLCRRQGDTTTTLATEAEVEALLARDWSQLIGSAASD